LTKDSLSRYFQTGFGEKLVVWFGEIERKLAKLLMTTFAYRSSSYLFYAYIPHLTENLVCKGQLYPREITGYWEWQTMVKQAHTGCHQPSKMPKCMPRTA
jgi:hypothetical protein